MDYGMIGKREKAKRYAEERNRFLFNKFDLTFKGDNNYHHVTFDNGVYACDCEFFITHQRCAHTMANYETAFWDSEIADNEPFEKWEAAGSVDSATRASGLGGSPASTSRARGAICAVTNTSCGPAARKSGLSKPPLRLRMLGIPSSPSSPCISSASDWLRP